MASSIYKNSKEHEERQLLSKVAREASTVANRENRALELPVQVVENGYVVEKFADGTTRIIKKLERVTSKISLKKGSILWLNPKG